MQKGPWQYKHNQIVDADGNQVLLQGVGLIMATVGVSKGNEGETDAKINSDLVQKAPELNYLMGKVVQLLDNPYTNDQSRLNELYKLLNQLVDATIPGAPYVELEK